MTYAQEMEKFKQHLAVILADKTGIDAGDSIEEMLNTIAIEYGDWKLGEVEDQSESAALEQRHQDDLADYAAAVRV